MTDAINTNNRIKTPNQPTEQRTNNPASAAITGSASSGSASAVVDLTSNKLMAQIDQLPEINNQRVEDIKTALANGEYQPNPEVIARKFAEIEQLLA